MKSVCLLVQNDYSKDIRVRRKAEALYSAGYRVDVLALSLSGSRSTYYCADGINVFTFSLGKKRGSKGRYLYEYATFFFWAALKLIKLMRKNRYDLIEVNTLPDFLVFAALYPRWKGAKILLDMHEITPEFVMSKYEVGPNHWQVRLARIIEKASFSFADHVITINEPIQELLKSRGLPLARSTVIMNSVDEALLAACSAREDATRLESLSGSFAFMYHGTLTRIYGLDIALAAFGEAQKELSGAEFWILGDGPEKRSLEKLCNKLKLETKVHFIGEVPLEEIPAWLSRCDVGILPTRQDVFLDYSFSNKLSEYIVCGKAVIISELRTIRFYFSKDALAYFQPNNPADLARQMIRLYGNGCLRTQLAEDAKREYAPIRWEVMKQRYLQLVVDLLRTSPNEF